MSCLSYQPILSPCYLLDYVLLVGWIIPLERQKLRPHCPPWHSLWPCGSRPCQDCLLEASRWLFFPIFLPQHSSSTISLQSSTFQATSRAIFPSLSLQAHLGLLVLKFIWKGKMGSSSLESSQNWFEDMLRYLTKETLCWGTGCCFR